MKLNESDDGRTLPHRRGVSSYDVDHRYIEADTKPPLEFNSHKNAQAQSLLNVVSAIDSDGEDPPPPPVLIKRPALFTSSPALDVRPRADSIHLSDTDSSSSSDGDDRSDERSENESTKSATKSVDSASRLSGTYLSARQVDSLIRLHMADIEGKRPWCFVFRCLKVPFESKRQDDPFDVFFMRWDEFWQVHGRAVWERAFWQPFPPHSTAYLCRKERQARARHAFRSLATDLVERFGNEYRSWLTKELREGWWHRTEPFSLRHLFARDRRL
ncbi:hypothetical protein PsorP6_017379 [Peronosclerospora sorghi]|uniref:Uncharacterized protein n=1 Tax=Peronosclerospora sorghi TaxID=230839 RepID=A0ACC0WKQ3_9STRA|nr:hypothetical protein PsorP6_017379 [Peronosclerospora sorghi]